jgi:hypothetical protein
MLANGAYLAAACVAGGASLDTPRLLVHGTHPTTIATYCLLTIGFGYVRIRRDCVQFFSPAAGDS